MEYVGEHTLIGQIGESFVILAVAAALLAAVSYLMAFRMNDTEDEKMIETMPIHQPIAPTRVSYRVT